MSCKPNAVRAYWYRPVASLRGNTPKEHTMAVSNTALFLITNIALLAAEEATRENRTQMEAWRDELLREAERCAGFWGGEDYLPWDEREEVVTPALEAAGIFLGTHRREFSRYECAGCSTVTYQEKDLFCFKCGKECERKEVIREVTHRQTEETTEEVAGPIKYVRMECPICMTKICLEEGSEIRFCPGDGGEYQRPQGELDAEAFEAAVDPVWTRSLQLLAKVGGNDRGMMVATFKEAAKFIFAKLFERMGSRLPFMIEGLKARFGSVLTGLGHYVQGTEALAKGLMRAQDAKGMPPKISGLHEKLQQLSTMMPQMIEAMLSSQDPEHLARCFAQGAVLGLQMNCSIKAIMGMREDPMVACLEEAAERGFGWAGLYAELDELATWMEAEHLTNTAAVKAAVARQARFEEEKAHIDAYLCGLNDRLAIAIAQVDIDVARCGQTLGVTWSELNLAKKDVEGALEVLKATMPGGSDDVPSVRRAQKLLEEAAKVGPNGASARIDAAVKSAAEVALRVGGRPYILYSDAMEARRCLGCGGNVGRLTVAENKEYVTDGLCLSCRRGATVDACDFSCMICGNRTGSASTVCELHRDVW